MGKTCSALANFYIITQVWLPETLSSNGMLLFCFVALIFEAQSYIKLLIKLLNRSFTCLVLWVSH